MKEKSSRGQLKGRNIGSRKRNRVILIAAEGKNKTETLYFKSFSPTGTKIHFAPGNETDPQKMMAHLLAECERLGVGDEAGDRAFCLVDHDADAKKDSQIAAADAMARATKGVVAQIISNPCYEVWYLCHKEYSTRQYASSGEVVETVGKRFKDYKKEDPNMYAKTIADVDTAIANAKKLEQYNQGLNRALHTASFMPSTEVYKVVETICSPAKPKEK